MSLIHPTAIISPGARMHPTVHIGPHVFIGEHVSIGRGTSVMANAYICGYTDIGEDNEIHIGAVIGHEPQDQAFDPTVESYVKIGNNNCIREYCTVHRGTKPESSTVIGEGNFLMAGAHVAHNVTIGNKVIIANNVMLGGYVTVADSVFISGGTGVHQFCTIGRLAMLSGNGRFSQDIPPFVNALERNVTKGVNLVGLRRAGLSKETIREIKGLYSMLYLSGYRRREALKKMDAAGFVSVEAAEFIAFVRNAKQSLIGHFNKHGSGVHAGG